MIQGITTELATFATAEIRVLIAALDRELTAEYSPELRHGLTLDAMFQPNIRFFLARLGAVAVGCGGVALFAGFAEVKRMYVQDSARGRGVAQALLARIESETLGAGTTLLRLETGSRQVAAICLYERAGFSRCPAFGSYLAMPPHALAASVFFEKRLGATAE